MDYENKAINIASNTKDASFQVDNFQIPTENQYQEAKEKLKILKEWLFTAKQETLAALDKLCELRAEELRYESYIEKLKEMIVIYETAHRGES